MLYTPNIGDVLDFGPGLYTIVASSNGNCMLNQVGTETSIFRTHDALYSLVTSGNIVVVKSNAPPLKIGTVSWLKSELDQAGFLSFFVDSVDLGSIPIRITYFYRGSDVIMFVKGYRGIVSISICSDFNPTLCTFTPLMSDVEVVDVVDFLRL